MNLKLSLKSFSFKLLMIIFLKNTKKIFLLFFQLIPLISKFFSINVHIFNKCDNLSYLIYLYLKTF